MTAWPPIVLDTVAAVTGGTVDALSGLVLFLSPCVLRSPLFFCEWPRDREPSRRRPPRRASGRLSRVDSDPSPERTCRDEAAGPLLPDITLSFQDDALDIVEVGRVVVDADTGVGSEANAHVIPFEVPVWR